MCPTLKWTLEGTIRESYRADTLATNRATHVPVGEDQSQHLEFARECVTNFNHTYGGSHLVAPQTILCKHPHLLLQFSFGLLHVKPFSKPHDGRSSHLAPTKRIMSLTDPLKKMSKSAPSPLSRILITDSPSTISRKMSSALTDSDNSVSYSPSARPGVSNLLTLLSSFDAEGRSPQELGEKFEREKMGLGAFKKLVAGNVGEALSGVRENYERIIGEKGYVDEVARRGAMRARESAEKTMVLVREAVGL